MIFETDKNGKSIVEDEKGCINYFLTNDAISDKIVRRVAEKYPNFIEKINSVLESDYTLDSLISKYKSEFLKRKIYSSTSVLFHSTVFSTSIDLIEDVAEETSSTQSTNNISYKNVGRNDLCPCGSGKKYKNCCLNK